MSYAETQREPSASVERQTEEARKFAASKGWTVLDAHIYQDDGISGAEFDKRPGLQRLLVSALSPRPPFQRLIVSEPKSIGREQAETQFVVKQLAQAGVEIYEYVHGQSLTPRKPMDKLLSTVQSYRMRTTGTSQQSALPRSLTVVTRSAT